MLRAAKLKVAMAVGAAGALAIGALVFAVVQPMLPLTPVGGRMHADPDRLRAHVRTLSETFHPRDFEHPENLDRAAAYMAAELERAGAVVSEHSYEVGGRTYRNVLARFGPESGERIVVGAHYDVCMPLPGADDNASGVAGLLELARLLAAQRPTVTVELVGFTLEEPPFFRTEHMGSFVHAASLRRAGVPLRGMLALEMIGFFTSAPDSQAYPAPLLSYLYPKTGHFIALVGTLGQGGFTRIIKKAFASGTALDVRSLNGPRFLRGVDFSDHQSYWKHGFPALMVTDTAFLRNPNYHTRDDVWTSLDFGAMAQVVNGVHAAVLGLGAAP